MTARPQPLARYAELHVRSNFTFLTGASHPEELVEQAAAVNLHAIAITDVNTLAGVVRAHVEARRVGLPLIIGAELQFQDGPRVVLLAMSRAGYANLSHILTIGRRRAPKGECYLHEGDVLLELSAGSSTRLRVISGGGEDEGREDLFPGGQAPRPPDGHVPSDLNGDDVPSQHDETPTQAHGLPPAGQPGNPTPDNITHPQIRGHAVPAGGPGDPSRGERETAEASTLFPPPTLRLLPSEPPRHDEMIAILLEPDPRDISRRSGQGTEAVSYELLRRWRRTFGDRLYLGLSRHLQAGDLARTRSLANLAAAAGVPVVAVNSVEMHTRARKSLHDVVACIREKTVLDDVGWHRLSNAESSIKPAAMMARVFHDMPDAVARTVEVAERVLASGFTLDQLRFEYPDEYVPQDENPTGYLRRLTYEGAARIWPDGEGGTSAIPEKVRGMCEYELSLIEELEYEPYFLTIHDVVQFARGRGILCQGRGSAANSAVCFCLGITAVDPATSNLLFERFISRERNEPPDIDVDFEHERREEVIQYVYEKYGRDHAAMVCEVIRYRGRSALREVGKALGLSLDQVDRLAKLRSHWSDGVPDLADLRRAGLDGRDRRVALTLRLAMEIQHFPRHLGIHVGGFVITRGPLSELVPVENATMADRTVIQWDKNDAESLGLLKVDCLALGMLTAIRKTFELVERVNGVQLDLATIPDDDPPTWAMIQRADTVGVFQIESRGQMSMLVRLKPQCFYDLVIEVAIMRPGPIQGGMVHPYLRRRNGIEPVEYPIPALKPVLERTLGVPLFQEQCMELAVVAAGFTPGEADQLRRAISAWRSHGKLSDLRDRLIQGMLNRGIEMQYAERVFEQIAGFGDYGFPESHAASFALIAWASCYLKAWYPAHFIGSVINSQPMGFYSTSALTQDVKRWGIEVRPVDVTVSEYDCTLEVLEEADNDSSLSSRSTKQIYGSTLFDLDGNGAPAHTNRDHRLRPVSQRPLSPSESPGKNENDNNEDHRGNPSASVPPGRIPPRPRVHEEVKPRVALRLGLRVVKGFSAELADRVIAARDARPFISVADFARRCRISQRLVQRLADAGGFRSFRTQRRDAVWDATWDHTADADQPLFANLPPPGETPALRPYSDTEIVAADYQNTGLSLHAHPMKLLRSHPALRGTITTADIRAAKNGTGPVTVAGIVQTRQRPSTAKGVTFITLEDEFGTCQLIVWQRTFEQYRAEVYGCQSLVVTGMIQSEDNVVNMIVHRMQALDEALQAAQIPTKSRDFC